MQILWFSRSSGQDSLSEMAIYSRSGAIPALFSIGHRGRWRSLVRSHLVQVREMQ